MIGKQLLFKFPNENSETATKTSFLIAQEIAEANRLQAETLYKIAQICFDEIQGAE